MTALETKPPSDIAEAQAKPLAGLVLAFRFYPDGSSEELNVDQPVSAGAAGSGSISTSPIRAPANSWRPRPSFPTPARALLVSGDEHQQLHGSEACLYGILADLVCGLDGATEEIGFLHFALTETLVHLQPPASAERHRSDPAKRCALASRCKRPPRCSRRSPDR